MDAQKLLEDVNKMPLSIHKINNSEKKSDQDEFDLAKIESHIQNGIKYPEPILSINNVPFIYPYTLNVIQGSQGSNKSYLAAHIASAFLNLNREPKLLNMTVNPNFNYVVAYLDTERPTRDQFPAAMLQTIKNAGLPANDKPSNFILGSLKKYHREERLNKAKEFIEKIKTENRHIILIIDVITDAMRSFNDLGETNALIDELNNITENEDITIIGVIHENPDGLKKARGHIGTEFVNKATTVISIGFKEFDSDILILKIVKNRLAKRQSEKYIKRCNLSGILEFINSEEIGQIESKNKIKIHDLAGYLIPLLMEKEHSSKELIKKIEDHFGASNKTVRQALNNLYNNQQILGEKGFELVIRKGKYNSNFYSIIKLESKSALV